MFQDDHCWRSFKEHCLSEGEFLRSASSSTSALPMMSSYNNDDDANSGVSSSSRGSNNRTKSTSMYVNNTAATNNQTLTDNSIGGDNGLVVSKCSYVDTPHGSVLVKEFVCGLCGKAFKTTKDCRRHTIIHSGSKPYRCPYCCHTANLSFNLKKHIQKLHPHMYETYLRQHCRK